MTEPEYPGYKPANNRALPVEGVGLVQNKWDRLPGAIRKLALRAAQLQAECDGEADASGGGGSNTMTSAESLVSLNACCSLVLSCRWSDGQEVAILDQDGRRVKVRVDNE